MQRWVVESNHEYNLMGVGERSRIVNSLPVKK